MKHQGPLPTMGCFPEIHTKKNKKLKIKNKNKNKKILKSQMSSASSKFCLKVCFDCSEYMSLHHWLPPRSVPRQRGVLTYIWLLGVCGMMGPVCREVFLRWIQSI